MRITDLLDKRSISLDAVCTSKSDAIDQAVALMVKSGKINDEEAYRKQVYLREEESTTGIGGNCNSTRKMRCSNQTGTGSNGSKGRCGF